jgi:hypothetical protein
MKKVKETGVALSEMKSQIDLIKANEIVETAQALKNLKKKLGRVGKTELEKTRLGLDNLARQLVPMKESEFSFMKVFGLEDNEIVHSSFLAWLLDPMESHGIGSYFAEKFLSKCVSMEKDGNLLDVDFTKLRVETERSGDKSRFDIRVLDELGNFQCIIENKIWSGEGDYQTKRLYNDFHDEAYPKELFVFLRVNPRSKPKDPHFILMNYEEVLQILQELLALAEGDTRFLIKHYSNTLERLIMSEKFEGFSERTQLYYQYYEYTNEIKKAFEKDRRLLLTALEEEIKQTSWWCDDVWKIEKSGGDICIWKDAWYVNETDGVFIQLYMHLEQPGFSLRVYGEPSDFSAKFIKIFRELLDEQYPGKMVNNFKKTFSSGVSRFIEKEIRLSPKEKTQMQKILKSLNEMLKLFEELIEKSINEFKKKSST